MKQLPVWVTASRRNYQSNIFTRTWWNIVIFHTFFVLVMVIVFGYVLYYTKLNLFSTVNNMLDVIIQGGTVDAALITRTSSALDRINFLVLSSMVFFAAITGVLAAHITLVPTRNEFAQRKKFITAVAHELRTPLAVLRTSNEVALYDVYDTESVRSTLEENIEETKHMANILNNLVIFSRVETEESLSFERVDLNTVLQSVGKKLEKFADKHAVTLAIEHSELPLISANLTAIEQIFYNLIKNAIIYSKPEGGTVNTKVTATATHVTIAITDNGIGMSQRNLKHIFEPFFRINPDSSPSAAGTGLGLALVLEIMKIHKGTIQVESQEGIGTTFTLQFPLAAATLINEPLPQSERSVTFSFEK